MAVSRLVVLLVAAALLIPVTFVATRHGGDSGSKGSAPAAAPAPTPKPAKPQPAQKPAAKPKTTVAHKVAPTHAARKPSQAKSTTNAKAEQARNAAAAKAGVPRRVATALAAHRTVVIFFSDGRGADDKATAASVRSIRGRAHGARFFADRLRNIGDYRLIVGNLGLSQSPSVVIVGQRGKARVVEGYVDSETLLQQVLDARR
jgi:hypothetical protein